MITVLFAAGDKLWPKYRAPLTDALAEAGIEAHLVTEAPTEYVDYIVFSPGATVDDFTPFTRAKAVLNLWAGVEKVVGNPTLKIPLCRMVDPAMTRSMTEYVVGHVMRHHLGMDRHIHGLEGEWRQDSPPIAPERRVAILGLGELGQAAARALTGLGFPVTGWSRSQRDIDGIDCRSGEAGLKATLAEAEIVVTLLPRTPETENILDAASLGLMPEGAVIINPGRGALIDDEALLAALDAGRLGHATLDTFRTEPLPADHPFWTHPRVTVTPHIAAETRASTASRVIVENIRRGEAGQPFLHLVDPGAGY